MSPTLFDTCTLGALGAAERAGRWEAGAPASIATPDHRLRVFVSSTLAELADERTAARAAIGRLRLTPVMFESGARPHSPRELYRAYLSQSDVFVGVYWQRYGHVAPGEAVSGLEDEYLLAGDRPKLIYVKSPAPERDPRLAGLLDRVKADDRASYKRFATSAELAELVADDLALLLTERFARGPRASSDLVAGRVPVPPTPIIGRDSEVAAVRALLRRPDVRLVTITGPGGIGKTRLELEVARGLTDDVDGVHFVDLAPVSDPALVPQAVAVALGVRTEGRRPVLEVLADRLADRRALLVLDNFEHVLAAAPDLSRLLWACPGLRMLVTSRAVLGVRGEHDYPLVPLSTPLLGHTGLAEVAESPAVRLFLARAEQVRPGFELTRENAVAVAAICQRLDGLPLAIELAAAQVRLLPPPALLRRLGARLDLPARSIDLPGRHQTLRATIGWSYSLLQPAERALLARLSVFGDGWTLEAAEAVAGAPVAALGADFPDADSPDADSFDVLDTLWALVGHSLVVAGEGAGAEPRFRMLDTIREYAQERLAERGEAAEVERRLAEHMRWLSAQAGRALIGPDNRVQFALLDAELDNLRAAVRWAIRNDDAQSAVRIMSPVSSYVWARGLLAPSLVLAEEVAALPSAATLSPDDAAWLLWLHAWPLLELGRMEEGRALLRRLVADADAVGDDALLARAQMGLGLALPHDAAGTEARDLLEATTSVLRRNNDLTGLAFALIIRGLVALRDGDLSVATSLHREALALADRVDSDFLRTRALTQLGQDALWSGDTSTARQRFVASAEATSGLTDQEGLSHCLAGFAGVALLSGRPEVAARLLGAARQVREIAGLAFWPLLQLVADRLDGEIRAALPEQRFLQLLAAGATLRPDQALTYALDATRVTSDHPPPPPAHRDREHQRRLRRRVRRGRAP